MNDRQKKSPARNFPVASPFSSNSKDQNRRTPKNQKQKRLPSSPTCPRRSGSYGARQGAQVFTKVRGCRPLALPEDFQSKVTWTGSARIVLNSFHGTGGDADDRAEVMGLAGRVAFSPLALPVRSYGFLSRGSGKSTQHAFRIARYDGEISARRLVGF